MSDAEQQYGVSYAENAQEAHVEAVEAAPFSPGPC